MKSEYARECESYNRKRLAVIATSIGCVVAGEVAAVAGAITENIHVASFSPVVGMTTGIASLIVGSNLNRQPNPPYAGEVNYPIE